MSVQHKDIPEAQLHEPKGISVASANQAYISNGAGSGAWSKIKSSNFQGLTGDGGAANKIFLSDGSNGFVSKTMNAYGLMGITNNSTNFAVSAAADSTLQNVADYVLFTGAGAPWAGESLFGVTFSAERLIAPVNGVYDVRFWSNISSYPTNTAFIGTRFKVNGTAWSPRTTIAKSNSAGDSGNLNAFGLVTLNANDYIQLFIASSATGNLVIRNANLTLDLRRAT